MEIESPPSSITAIDGNSVLPGFDELIVKDNFPLSVHEFAVTECQKWITWAIFTGGLSGRKIFEGIW
jgi:hypothetical protein